MDQAAARRLLTALELHDLGVAMMAERLRREDPAASDEQIRHRLRDWLHTRPGAEFGDGEGQPVAWPRTRT